MLDILLTGSSGFLGNYFIDKYSKKYNIKTFSFLNDDFKALDLSEIDTVLHLSALVHKMGEISALEYEKSNVIETVELAKKAKKSGVRHFIFMSTVKVYGEETEIAYTENSECKPKDQYGKSKLKAEGEIQKLIDDSFVVSIVRTPIVYGYGVKANIKNLISLVKKVPILPFDDIQNRRSMVYIGNLCNLIDTIVQNGVSLESKSGIFLASDDKALSTTRLIELIAKELDKKIFLIKPPFFEIILKRVKPSFHKRLYKSLEVDNSMTKKSLAFENLYTTEDGIKFMIHGESR